MNKINLALATFSVILLLVFVVAAPIPAAGASGSNPNLFVSAENSQFDDHFYGSMVVEVIVIDPSINDVSQRDGHPYVTINGRPLQMVQTVDGNWYAYFGQS